MTMQRKFLVGCIILACVVVIGFLYSHSFVQAPTKDASLSQQIKVETPLASKVVAPSTPDAIVDTILKDASFDDITLQSDVKNEKDAVSANSIDIDMLSQFYDGIGAENHQSASCDSIITMSHNSLQSFSEKKRLFEDEFEGKTNGFENSRDAADAQQNDNREKQDEVRNEMYTNLEDIANGDAAKLATLDAFKTITEDAVSSRRDALDGTVKDFRKSVDDLLINKKTDVIVAIDAFQSSADMAFKKAETDCANGIDSQIVSDTLSTSIRDARVKLQTTKQSFEKTSESIPVIADAKKSAIDKAMQKFTAIIEQARIDLKVTFGA